MLCQIKVSLKRDETNNRKWRTAKRSNFLREMYKVSRFRSIHVHIETRSRKIGSYRCFHRTIIAPWKAPLAEIFLAAVVVQPTASADAGITENRAGSFYRYMGETSQLPHACLDTRVWCGGLRLRNDRTRRLHVGWTSPTDASTSASTSSSFHLDGNSLSMADISNLITWTIATPATDRFALFMEDIVIIATRFSPFRFRLLV